jgi:HK97 gp10 family phage protein
MTVKVHGVRQTKLNLRELGQYVSTPANAAARKALRPTLAEAKSNAPKKSGLLRKSLTIKKSRSQKARPKFRVGPDAATEGPNGEKPIKYAHITEFGRAPNKGGKGGMKGTRWLTRAYESTRDGVSAIFGAEIGPAIEKHAARLAQKARR